MSVKRYEQRVRDKASQFNEYGYSQPSYKWFEYDSGFQMLEENGTWCYRASRRSGS